MVAVNDGGREVGCVDGDGDGLDRGATKSCGGECDGWGQRMAARGKGGCGAGEMGNDRGQRGKGVDRVCWNWTTVLCHGQAARRGVATHLNLNGDGLVDRRRAAHSCPSGIGVSDVILEGEGEGEGDHGPSRTTRGMRPRLICCCTRQRNVRTGSRLREVGLGSGVGVCVLAYSPYSLLLMWERLSLGKSRRGGLLELMLTRWPGCCHHVRKRGAAGPRRWF